jgi:glycogen operon protein
MVPLLAARLVGSPDLYEASGAGPYHSINFITSHDGFTLADLVAYNRKLNRANGEGEADGAHENYSWNCGAEGPSTAPEIGQLRTRQMKNLAALLLLSQGVPMILSGDEMGRTQQGNNNPYCHDNEISWLNWGYLQQHADLFRFFQLLISFRKHHPVLRRRRFDSSESHQPLGVVWHGCRIGQPDWSWESRSLALHLLGGNEDIDLFLIANAHWESLTFELPALSSQKQWYRFVDTWLAPPDDICHAGAEPPLANPQHYGVGPRTVVVLVGQ